MKALRIDGSRGLPAGLALGVWLVAGPAMAGNTEHPRTPVLWPDAPCIQTVVRADDPLFAFAYAIPAEDTALSIDELEDSRTHQFFGFCRQWPAGNPPPRYVTTADLDRAIMAGFEDADLVGEPEATLETSVAWAGCWTRITADDARRPITFAAAAEPVAWDTTGLSAGSYVIAGYTWEPPYNLWSRTPWALRIVDADPAVDPTPIQAAVSLADTEDAVGFDGSVDVDVCVAAELGATVTLEWTSAKDPTWEWAPVTEAVLSEAGEQALTLAFTPPEPSWGATVLLRAHVDQPEGPDDDGHALAPIIVFKPPDPGDTGDGDGDGDGDGSGDAGETGTDGTGDEDGGTSSNDPSVTGGGRCSLAPGRGNLSVCLALLALFGLRRRRHG